MPLFGIGHGHMLLAIRVLKSSKRPHIKSFLQAHPISVHTKFEEDPVISFPNNGQKPFSHFFAIRGQNLGQGGPKSN